MIAKLRGDVKVNLAKGMITRNRKNSTGGIRFSRSFLNFLGGLHVACKWFPSVLGKALPLKLILSFGQL